MNILEWIFGNRSSVKYTEPNRTKNGITLVMTGDGRQAVWETNSETITWVNTINWGKWISFFIQVAIALGIIVWSLSITL